MGEWHRMGGPADKPLPRLLHLMPEGSVWRVFNHKRNLDLGDMTVLTHRRSGLECYLHQGQIKMTYPWPADDKVALDRHNHLRMLDENGEIKATFAPA
jgi:hypothetical protein